MRRQGFCLTKEMLKREQNNDEIDCVKQVPFNKESLYQDQQDQSKYKGNATLPLEYNGVKTMAILDTAGWGIGIATKVMWVKWGTKSIEEKLHGFKISRWKYGMSFGFTRTHCN